MGFLGEEVITTINYVLQKSLGPCLVILFGSFAKGVTHGDSDVDIAFLGDKEYSAYEVFIAAEELASLVGRDVDLVDLARASTVMKAHIVSSGRVLYCADELRCMEFFMNALKEYAVLNERRLPVLANYGIGGGESFGDVPIPSTFCYTLARGDLSG